MRPTQPVNSSCPGQPCLTLSQYIKASDQYFKSNNNSVFWLLSGTHDISSPVLITNAFNVTIRSYPVQHHGYNPLIFFNSTKCECPQGGVCQECSTIQFYNTSEATVEGIQIIAVKSNTTSSISGISFYGSDTITVQSVSVSISVAESVLEEHGVHSNRCKYISILCGGILLRDSTRAFILNLTLNFVGIHAHYTRGILLQNLTVVSSCRHAITVYHVSNMSVQYVEVSKAESHCIRLEKTHDVSVSEGTLHRCGDNGIQIEAGSDTVLDSIHFIGMGAKAINLVNLTRNTTIRNSRMSLCPIVCIQLEFVFYTLFHNVTVADSGILGRNIWGTSFVKFNMTTSGTGMVFLNASHTVIKDTYLTITQGSFTQGSVSALYLNNLRNATIENVVVNAPVSIQNCYDIVLDGICIRNVTNQPAVLVYGSSSVTVKHTCFKGFFDSVSDTTDHPAVAVLYQSRDINFENCTFTENKVSAMKAVGSNVTFSGGVIFSNNTAPLGAAMILQQKSVIKLALNSSLLFIGNHATSVGGAVYVDSNTFYGVDSENSETITLYSVCSFQFLGNGPIFINNSAGNGGDVVYGGHMGLANAAYGSNCLTQFKQVSVINQTNTMSVISSQPSRVCLCNSTGQPDCLTIFHSHTVYPGESISLPAVVVGQDFGAGAGSVYGQFLSSDVDSRLEQWQYSQLVAQTHCNQLTYSILAAPTHSTVLVLTVVETAQVQVVSNDSVHSALEQFKAFQNGNGRFPQDLLDFPVYINISVQPCPLGFSLSESPYQCVCSPQLRKLPGVKCYIENKTFERSGASWIGLNEDKHLAVSQYCLLLFCKETEENVSLDDLDVQCNYNHSGVLCGGCQEGLSAVLGSHRCLRCSNTYLSLLIPIAMAGVVLVLAIKTLDITVSGGYINSLTLYFNLIQSSWAVLRPWGHNNVLTIIVSWTNLDLGIESCFFDGLTEYWKMWLQFLFPLYIWIIAGVVVVLARYSNRAATIIGSNAVSVLPTLFLLSYNKLLRSCIAIISYSSVEYPNYTKMVWLLDGDIDYLGAKHLPLLVVAVAVLIFLCVPYTLTLLLGQWLIRSNNRFISRAMFRIKPFMDAYYGPLKDKHRYWIGVLLLSRAILHIVLALTPDKSSGIILLAMCLLAIFLLQMIGYVMGFYRSWYVSAYEVTIVSNLAVYSLAKLYSEQTVIDYIFTAAATFQLGCLVLYRLYVLIKYRLPTVFTLPWRKIVKLGGVGAGSEDNWEVNEEASLLRQSSENIDDGSDETILVHSLPT